MGHKRCANKFSEEDKAELTEMALRFKGTTVSRRCSTLLARRASRAKSTLSSRHKQWRRLPQRLQQQVLQPRLLLSFVQLDAKKFTPSSLCSFQYFIIYAFRRTSRFFKTIFFSGSLK